MADQDHPADPDRLSLLDALRSLQELIDSPGEEAGPPAARAPATAPEAAAKTADAQQPGERAEPPGPAPAGDWDDIPLLDEVAFEQGPQAIAAGEAAARAENTPGRRRAALASAAAVEAKYRPRQSPPGEAVIGPAHEPTPPPVSTEGAPGASGAPTAAPRQTAQTLPVDARALASRATALIEAELHETSGRVLRPALAEELRQLLERFLRERLEQAGGEARREQTP